VAGGVSRIREISGGAGLFSQDSMVAAFGLGTTSAIDSLIVRWPSGIVQVVEPVPAVDQAITVVEPAFLFVDATSGPLGDAGVGKGVAWGDYDNDGDLDLFVTSFDQTNQLIRNDGGGVFTDVTTGPLGGPPGNSAASAWGDYDNDGDLDLYVVRNNGPNQLIRNDGGGVFVDATSGPLGDAGNGGTVAWTDFDNDGNLDLYLSNAGMANRLFRNEGAGVFVDVTSGPLGDTGSGWSATWADYDNDGDPDLYLTNYGSLNHLYRNDGGGAFTDVTSGPLGGLGDSLGAAWGDYDNDGDFDLYVVSDITPNMLLRNDGEDVFTDVTTGQLAGLEGGRGVAWGDYDNDGDLDLYLANLGQPNKLLRNDGSGVFADATIGALGDTGQARGVAWGDYDNDGDLDLYVVNQDGPNRLLRNEAAAGNHWLQVKLEGTVSNRAAIGARVRMVAGGVSQIRQVAGGTGLQSQDAMVVSLGLGAVSAIDSLIVRWPSGIVQVVEPVPAVDQLIAVVESSGVTAVEQPDGGAPLAFRLVGAFPNPFNPSTTIRFDLPRSSQVELMIYDVAGRRVRTLVRETREAGPHEVTWRGLDERGRPVVSGVYFCRLRAGNQEETSRVTLLK